MSGEEKETDLNTQHVVSLVGRREKMEERCIGVRWDRRFSGKRKVRDDCGRERDAGEKKKRHGDRRLSEGKGDRALVGKGRGGSLLSSRLIRHWPRTKEGRRRGKVLRREEKTST